METALIVISILIIAIVLLQSNKASDGSNVITGGNQALFQHQKERGLELLITRVTIILATAFIIISFIMSVN